MASYKQTTITKHLIYPIQFMCPYCGQPNSTAVSVAVSSKYNTSLSPSQREVERKSSAAAIRLSEEEQKKNEEIRAEERRQNYFALHPTCVCSSCGKRPPWAYAENSFTKLLTNLGVISFLVGFIALLFALASKSGYQTALLLFLPAAVSVVRTLLEKAVVASRSAKLDPKYCPKIQYPDEGPTPASGTPRQ